MRLMPAQKGERDETKMIYRLQNRYMPGMTNAAAMRGVIVGMSRSQ